MRPMDILSVLDGITEPCAVLSIIFLLSRNVLVCRLLRTNNYVVTAISAQYWGRFPITRCNIGATFPISGQLTVFRG